MALCRAPAGPVRAWCGGARQTRPASAVSGPATARRAWYPGRQRPGERGIRAGWGSSPTDWARRERCQDREGDGRGPRGARLPAACWRYGARELQTKQRAAARVRPGCLLRRGRGAGRSRRGRGAGRSRRRCESDTLQSDTVQGGAQSRRLGVACWRYCVLYKRPVLVQHRAARSRGGSALSDCGVRQAAKGCLAQRGRGFTPGEGFTPIEVDYTGRRLYTDREVAEAERCRIC